MGGIGHMLLYRGSLKSCNYQCSYCPFSKHSMSAQELAKDRAQWFSFVEQYEKRAGALGIHALMIVPYGEALIHPWYWEGLARITSLPETEAAGAQTNLSFSIESSLKTFEERGGIREKVRLWATFHPQMTSVSEFASRCGQLAEKGISICAGSVGVPENLEILRKLKESLPKGVYLWVNKMDGLGRPYTREEREGFLEIDPYFIRELTPVPKDAAMCEGRLLVEGNGKVHTCNISKVIEHNWEKGLPSPVCNRKICSCYLAYGGRTDFMNRVLFGKYPLFRIPRRPGAVFFDIEGTLLNTEKQRAAGSRAAGAPGETAQGKGAGKGISHMVLAGLAALVRGGTWLFFATTLPYEEAVKRCRKIRHLFRGGIFSGGAHLRLEAARKHGEGGKISQEGWGDEGLRECFMEMDETVLSYVTSLAGTYRFRLLVYKAGNKVYKLTLLRSSHRPWEEQEAEELFRGLPAHEKLVRYYREGNCLQIVRRGADKAAGVRTLCQWLDISAREAVAVGDSEEDEEMMKLCGMPQEKPPAGPEALGQIIEMERECHGTGIY